MENKINMKRLFIALDNEMKLKLSNKIDEIHHPTTKGDEAELNWKGLLKNYLPGRYKIDSGFVIDYKGNISQQIDIIVYDRHFTPFIFKGERVKFIPAEAVYCIFEIKPELNSSTIKYAKDKIESVRKLTKTSAEFPHIGGRDRTTVSKVIGGLLTKRARNKNTFKNIKKDLGIDFIVCLDKGVKLSRENNHYTQEEEPILAFFLLKLVEELRNLGSASALEIDKYLNTIYKK